MIKKKTTKEIMAHIVMEIKTTLAKTGKDNMLSKV